MSSSGPSEAHKGTTPEKTARQQNKNRKEEKASWPILSVILLFFIIIKIKSDTNKNMI
jgi:hypothetical protein